MAKVKKEVQRKSKPNIEGSVYQPTEDNLDRKNPPGNNSEVEKSPVPEIKSEIPEELIVVSASEWRKKNINLRKEKLPTGITVMVRNVSLQNLTARGAMPVTLLTRFLNMQDKLNKAKNKDPKKAYESLDTNDMAAFNELCDKVCLAAIVEPKITENDTGDNDSIPISELEFEDKTYIFGICIREGALPYAGFS